MLILDSIYPPLSVHFYSFYVNFSKLKSFEPYAPCATRLRYCFPQYPGNFLYCDLLFSLFQVCPYTADGFSKGYLTTLVLVVTSPRSRGDLHTACDLSKVA